MTKNIFGVVHSLEKIWEERELLNSKGKGLIHERLISEVLEALQLPRKLVLYTFGDTRKEPP